MAHGISDGEPSARAKPWRLRALFLAHRGDLLGYLIRKVGAADAPDLLQETFLRLIRHDRLDAIDDPPAFLKRIAVNLARDFARRRRTEERRLQIGDFFVELPSAETSPEERIELERRTALLRKAVDTLPPRCREAFELHIYHDMPLKEVALRMEISDRMARKHVTLALKVCRAALRSPIE
ncbi:MULTISPECIES: RNA polymerase sigma factor [Methylosinus]|uniref:Sigma-70 family RNA polymerase sigma factor n=1 Tax=Methylosinus trichosporium (strain ATCC 35070 / NCIMB 11131 / UNIQEM 75 / OB3b) TaxID=595536 RepID=A0A2D2CVR8_METT3|nr:MULTISPECIES: sigma-70 family RNA polymerase sigma factor [Methylosinus]ATQ66823.1 sigma-70 family RNA polymerase sigma factor [Methylosinus trichosporium OB3b]OBS50640.1 RNA polymerase subunit sigma-24 [Methylosinus sp. 3S-1]